MTYLSADVPPPPPSRHELRQNALAEQPRHGLGRFFGLTTLGTLVPGAGLIGAGRRVLGGTLLTLFVLLALGIGAFFYWEGPTNGAMYIATQPKVLTAVLYAGSAVVAVWVLSVLITGWAARATPSGFLARTGMTLFVALMSAALVIPAALAGQRALIGQETLTKLFTDQKLKQADNAKAPSTTAADPWENVPRVTVLLLGTDAYPDREGLRTDSMMVATIDTQTGDTLLMGIPRNLEGWRIRPNSPMRAVFPSGVANCPAGSSDCLLTNYWRAVEVYAKDHPKAYPGDPKPSLTELRQVIGDFLGVQIDNTAMIDIRGFSSVVDALGGVTINVKEKLPIGGRLNANHQIVPGSITGWIEPGVQHMNGYTAMWYSRSRVTTDDFARMRRQRCMIGALARQVNPTTMIAKFPQLAKVAQDNLLFDIDLSQLPAWGQLGMRIRTGTIRSLPFTSTLFNNVHPDYDWVHAYVAHAIDPTVAAPTTDGHGRPLPSKTSSTSTSSSTKTSTKPVEGVVNVDDAC